MIIDVFCRMLPKDLLVEVFSYTEDACRIDIMLVCKAWYDAFLLAVSVKPITIIVTSKGEKSVLLDTHPLFLQFKYGIYSLRLINVHTTYTKPVLNIISKVVKLKSHREDIDYKMFPQLKYLTIDCDLDSEAELWLPESLVVLRIYSRAIAFTINKLPNLRLLKVLVDELDLSLFPALTNLIISYTTCDMSYVPDLIYLRTYGCTLNNFNKLTKLKKLILRSTDVNLSHLTTLTKLQSSKNTIRTVTPLQASKITKLVINEGNNIDLTPFSNLTHLKMVDVNTSTCLSTLAKLQYVDIHYKYGAQIMVRDIKRIRLYDENMVVRTITVNGTTLTID
jgi:hypothetical protein